MTTTKFGLLKFYSGFGKLNLNSQKGFSPKIINVQTALNAAYIIIIIMLSRYKGFCHGNKRKKVHCASNGNKDYSNRKDNQKTKK